MSVPCYRAGVYALESRLEHVRALLQSRRALLQSRHYVRCLTRSGGTSRVRGLLQSSQTLLLSREAWSRQRLSKKSGAVRSRVAAPAQLFLLVPPNILLLLSAIWLPMLSTLSSPLLMRATTDCGVAAISAQVPIAYSAPRALERQLMASSSSGVAPVTARASRGKASGKASASARGKAGGKARATEQSGVNADQCVTIAYANIDWKAGRHGKHFGNKHAPCADSHDSVNRRRAGASCVMFVRGGRGHHPAECRTDGRCLRHSPQGMDAGRRSCYRAVSGR